MSVRRLSTPLLAASGVLCGYALGGPSQVHRGELALNTGWRGVSAAVSVGLRNFPREHDVFTMAIIVVLVSAAMLMPLSATCLRRRDLAQSTLSA